MNICTYTPGVERRPLQRYQILGCSTSILPNISSFMELTISDYHVALRHGRTTCVQAISACLSRIAYYDPTLRAPVTVNLNTIHEAYQKDTSIMEHLLPLHGKILSAGATMLAKANLHELSLEGVTVSSLGGQSLNPYNRTPSSSSGGTAAANLGLIGCGGDTTSLQKRDHAVVNDTGRRGADSKDGESDEIVIKTIELSMNKVTSANLNVQFIPLPHHPDREIALLCYAQRQTRSFLQSSTISSTAHQILLSIAASGEYLAEAMTPVFWMTLQGGEYMTTGSEYRARIGKIKALKTSATPCFQGCIGEVDGSTRPKWDFGSFDRMPAIYIPAGFSPPTFTAPLEVHIGHELMGRPWQDKQLLELAERFESIIPCRKPPLI
ncbi:uncharacterized protein ATNIH1004_000284 [Aspergillus tanneri]|uniref:Uncharacterized protein n=1 Tax=Aspergillus tanneri TaxID=1220188 RepID=A0A5M9MW94_9EURO|nr:uncharacterized protein ATNIH1004_000284 [Aspergillus tanneri]KAA8651402.1 hypothetical protein ATNIH1004_000284 [Aspergillus tanneri]